MTTTKQLLALLVALLVVGCAADRSDVPVPPPTASDGAQEALVAYERYWSVSQDAFGAPGARDWTSELAEVASGPALDSLLRDVRNYAEFPAHVEGVVSRAPTVVDVKDATVLIVDCIDLGDSRLVADRTGEILDDLESRVQRYTFRADVVLSDDVWRVNRTDAAQDEPC